MRQTKLLKRAEALKAMGHPSRLLIIEALVNGEKCVGELQSIVGSDLSTVSRHIAVLKNAGILADRRQGTHMFYYLSLPCRLNFLECIDAVINESDTTLDKCQACQRAAER